MRLQLARRDADEEDFSTSEEEAYASDVAESDEDIVVPPKKKSMSKTELVVELTKVAKALKFYGDSSSKSAATKSTTPKVKQKKSKARSLFQKSPSESGSSCKSSKRIKTPKTNSSQGSSLGKRILTPKHGNSLGRSRSEKTYSSAAVVEPSRKPVSPTPSDIDSPLDSDAEQQAGEGSQVEDPLPTDPEFKRQTKTSLDQITQVLQVEYNMLNQRSSDNKTCLLVQRKQLPKQKFLCSCKLVSLRLYSY